MGKKRQEGVLVSVVIPTFNEGETILSSLNSLAKQQINNFEVVVVDDGSKDEIGELLRAKEFKNFRFRFFRRKHQGAGAARNFGAGMATGDIFVFVDADMTFDPHFLKNLTDPIIKEGATGTFSREEYLENKANRWARYWNLARGLPADRMHPKDYPDTQKVFRAITREAFEKAGGFDERSGYTDDWSLSERLGLEAKIAKGAIFYHKNPETLKDIFVQSKWISKRKYKAGIVGTLIALLRVSLPFSLVRGLFHSFRYGLGFLVFVLISDWGQFLGILEYSLLRKVSK